MSDAPHEALRGTVQTMGLKEFVDFGYLAEVNRQFLHPLGLALAIDIADRTVQVWDARDDDEGWVFSGVEFPALAAKEARVRAEQDARFPRRLAHLGYIIQSIDPGVGRLHPSQIAMEVATQEAGEEVKSKFASDAPPPFTPQGFTDGEGYVEERNHEAPS
jgi:hypothetical protein